MYNDLRKLWNWSGKIFLGLSLPQHLSLRRAAPQPCAQSTQGRGAAPHVYAAAWPYWASRVISTEMRINLQRGTERQNTQAGRKGVLWEKNMGAGERKWGKGKMLFHTQKRHTSQPNIMCRRTSKWLMNFERRGAWFQAEKRFIEITCYKCTKEGCIDVLTVLFGPWPSNVVAVNDLMFFKCCLNAAKAFPTRRSFDHCFEVILWFGPNL